MEVRMKTASRPLAGFAVGVMVLAILALYGTNPAFAGHIDATGPIQSNCVDFQAGETGTKSPVGYPTVSVTLDSWADTPSQPHQVTFTIGGLTTDQEMDISVKSGTDVVEAGPYGNGQHTYTSVDQQAISHIRLCVFPVDTTSSSSSSSTSTSSSTTSSSIAATSSTTTTTVGEQVQETSTTTIEDEVLGTVITTSSTSTTIEDEVLDTEVLPFTGLGGAGFGLLALAIISAGLLFLVAGRSIER